MQHRNPIGALLAALLILAGAIRAAALAPERGDFSKSKSTDIRILDWNIEKRFISTAASDGNFQRVLSAVKPDIIVFEEMNANSAGGVQPTAAEIQTRLQSILGGSWTVNRGNSDGFNRNVLASRFGISLQRADTLPASEVRGVVMGLVDIPGPVDLYVMGAHFKSGDSAAVDSGTLNNEQRRQKHADAVANWQRDARTAGGNINLPAGTPMIFCGDTNLNFGALAPSHPYETLLTGDIVDNATYGADAAPDWNGTPNADPWPYDANTGDSDTHSSNTGFPTSRYDRFTYTDSVIQVVGKYVLNSQTMSAGALTASGIQVADTNGTLNGPDHLPLFIDFRLGPEPAAAPGKLIVNEFNFDNTGTDTHSFVEFRNTGKGALNLSGPVSHFLVRSGTLTATAPTADNESSRIKLEGVVPPGAYFVLYNASADSSGIAATIQAALPGAQRQNSTSFSLFNGPNRGIALVTASPTGLSTVADTALEGYLYASNLGAASPTLWTDSSNNLKIVLTPAQSSSNNLISTAQSYSRNKSYGAANNFAGWTIPDTMTPGRVNHTGVNAAEDWVLYR